MLKRIALMFLIVPATLCVPLLFLGCEAANEGPVEEGAEAVEETAEEVGESAEEAIEEAADEVDDATTE